MLHNRSTVYVIGLTPFNLLQIEFKAEYTPVDIVTCVFRVTHGIMNITSATQIHRLEDAECILRDIQTHADEIYFHKETILESIIDGNNIDASQLHIYEVNISIDKEVL